ncbi:hemerythrin domain-containing protein [Kitasatospora sp. NPDC051170]|uniref:hemerythrin domain-containing protein n=1 Tax=Kitasatospora sp. NPDC051170 TaxID=3364056 RepID=UPI00378EFFB8
MVGAENFPTRLYAEHRAIEAVLGRLDAGGPPLEDLRLLGCLQRLLIPHLAAEEEHLYPLVRRHLSAGGPLADVGAHTHATIRRLLEQALEAQTSPTGRRATAALLIVLRAHLHGEEQRLFPALRARAAPEELRRCERRLHAGRPEPPASPVWGLPPGTGAIAAVRDHLTGHDTSSQRRGSP